MKHDEGMQYARAAIAALEALQGEQTVSAIENWIEINRPGDFHDRKIGTALRGFSDMEKPRERHPDLKGFHFIQVRRGVFALVQE